MKFVSVKTLEECAEATKEKWKLEKMDDEKEQKRRYDKKS
jgi:hypothetical protein